MAKATETHTTLPAEFSEIAAICTATEIKIGGRTMFGIADARDLHIGLKVRRDYTTWIKGRIAKYGFRDGADFEKVVENQTPPFGGTTNSMTYTGVQVAHVYRLSLDMAKELAMVENNEQGRLVRRYFIWADEQFRQAPSPEPRRRTKPAPDKVSGVFEPGSNLLKDLILAAKVARVRVQDGHATDPLAALHEVLEDYARKNAGKPTSGKPLGDWNWKRIKGINNVDLGKASKVMVA